jgi:hypothetical protein
LIIDVRENGGGSIRAAERLLQVLSPISISPERAQFINTALNLHICRNHEERHRAGILEGFTLKPWIGSIADSVETGATYSLGFSITSVRDCNDIGQQYFGPKVLITDALCYSATDIFAAGFQDHGIGPILGVHRNTGAGGANVWSHRMLRLLARTRSVLASVDSPGRPEAPADPITGHLPSPYRPLPRLADFSTAMRRTLRVQANEGSVIEDLGVRPDHFHRMTQQDVLGHNEDLIETASKILAGEERHDIRVEIVTQGRKLPRVVATTMNVDRLDVRLDSRPVRSYDVKDDETKFDLSRIAKPNPDGPSVLELQGFRTDALTKMDHIVVSPRIVLQPRTAT